MSLVPPRLLALIQSAWSAGLAHLVVSIVFLQGLTQLSQLAMASLLGPADFGIVRSVEANLSVLLVAASLGMPSLAVKCIAEVSEPLVRSRLLGRLLLLSLFSSIAVAVCATLVPAPLADARANGYLKALVWVMALTSCSRTCFNYFQGIKDIHRISVLISMFSMAGLGLLVASVSWFGLEGWVAGRYVNEFLLLTLAVSSARPALRFGGGLPDAYSSGRLVSLGIPIALSFLVRAAFDSVGVLSLGYLGARNEEIGYFGLANLVATALLIIPSGIAALALPRIAERRQDARQVWLFLLRVGRWSIFLMLILSGLAALLAPTLIAVAMPRYSQAAVLMRIVLLATPFRALVALCGTAFLAYDENARSLLLNALLLAVSIVLSVLFVPRYGASGAAWVSLVCEVMGCAMYVTGTWALVRRHGTPAAPGQRP